jgi:putative transposase
MFLTYKTRIFPTNIQKYILWDLAEKCRLLYNFALAERKIVWEQAKQFPKTQREYLTYIDQQNALPQLKKRYPEYRWVYSKVLQMVLRTLDADFKSFFALRKKDDKTARPPKFKRKRVFYPLKYNQSGFKLEGENLSLSHHHPSQERLDFSLSYLPVGKVKQVELYYDHLHQQWYVSFNCEVEVQAYQDNGLYQAFDSGINNIVSAYNSQGKFLQIPNRRPEKYWRKKIAAVQAKRDHCKVYSRKWHFYNDKMQHMIRKLANQLKDWQHKLSKIIVTNTKANTLIFGKPAVKKMVKKSSRNSRVPKARKTLHYPLQNTGSMSRFIKLVAYKAKKVGKRVILIDEAYTSQICPRCGILKSKPLSNRFIVCSNCGLQIDRDLAASINLLASFYLQKRTFANLLHEPSVNEESFLLKWKGFLRQTVKGKTRISLSTFTCSEFDELVGSPVL